MSEVLEAIYAAIEYLDDLPSCSTLEAEVERATIIEKLSRALDAIDGGES